MKTLKVCVCILVVHFGAGLAYADMPTALMARTQNTIQGRFPTVTNETLAADRLAVEAAFRSTQSRLSKKGFSEKQIAEIVLTAWINKRKDPTMNLSEIVITNEVRKHGLLIVKSDPSEASVTIDREKARNTECEKWVPSGTYHIVISKEGYLPEEGRQAVAAETRVVFSKTLRRAGPDATKHH